MRPIKKRGTAQVGTTIIITPDNYDWQQRNNPCSESYYNQSHFKTRNIFASNLGLIAKEGKGNSMIFVVTNLITSQPEAGVKLKVYDFQNQLLEELETGNNGIVSVYLAKKPFVLIAEKGNQTGYLRLDDGTALSLSNFDVSGEIVQHGLKGFIYGERGVWRPGDKLFLTFVLEDKLQQLPENHPVIFKLINPRGQVVEKRIVPLNNTGFYKFEIKTEDDAPTGNWNAEVQVGSTLFSKRLKIETVKPNRLKINLKVPELIQTSSSKSIELNAQWLHGTPAKSLKTTIDLNLTKGTTKFEGFEKYSFTDLASSFYTEEQEFFKGELNKEGNIDVPVNFSGIEKAPGMLQAYFTTKVFEEGGDFSINVQTAKISPYKKYVGVKMPDSEDNWFKTGTDYKAEIVCVDANGESVNTGLVEAELFKIDWRWWWESGDDNLAHYVNSRYQKPVAKWKINNINKKGALKINVKYRDWRDNGRYLLRVKDVNGGHASGVTFYMSKWGSWQADESAEGATMLSIKTEKETYKTGEKVKVIIPSSENSRALVSIESGSVVKDIFWVETTAQATTFEFDALPEMAPNVFVHVSLIQPYGQTKNDAPLRLYGVTPVLIKDPKTVLNPEIIVKDEIEPEEDYQVEVSEKIGSPMTYTLAVVDEGLLDLTNYRTPDPHSAFYAREALGVKTWDLYDMVAGAYGARLEKAFAVGGDENLLDRGKKKANRFKPVVEFIGPFSLQKGQSQKHTLKMPNYIGSVKVMVVAGNNGAYGNTDKVVKVRKGLMLLATVPRVLAPREKLVLPVTVFAYKNTIKKVKLKVKTNAFFEKSALLEKEITFDEQGEQVVYFELQVKDKTGQVKITVEASSGGEKASSETDINVTNPNPPLVLDKNALVQPGTDWQAKIQKPGMEGTNQAWFEVSAIPSLNLSNHLEKLINYPHGCIEQTVSAALAQLFLPKMAELDDYQKSTIEDNIRSALKRLMVFQLQDGGFSYWPGSSDSHSWGSSYAGHFMVLAEQQGYSLPFGIKKNWLRFQTYKAKNWVSKVNNSEGLVNNSNELDQAYRLYTLALLGNAEMGAMNRFREQVKSAAAKWRLAAAYGLAGQTKAAEELINGIPHSVGEYTELSGTFGNALRDKAMILETLILQKNREAAFVLLKEISEELNEKSWLSTQTAAWCFYSASQFVDKMVAEGGINFQLKINGKTENISAKLPVLKMPVDFDQEGSVNIEFKNRNNNLVYARLVAKGIPIEGDYQTQDRQLNMNVWLANKSGEKIENNIFYQGDDVVLNVEVVHPGNRGAYEEMALTTALPSGFEILNQRLFDIPSENGNSFEYQDVRDSRIMTYFDIPSGNKKLFQFKVNTAYEGKYYFPPVVCEAMYNNAIYASTPGMWIEIIKQ